MTVPPLDPVLSDATVKQLRAGGWSDEKILLAALRKTERAIKGTRDTAILRKDHPNFLTRDQAEALGRLP